MEQEAKFLTGSLSPEFIKIKRNEITNNLFNQSKNIKSNKISVISTEDLRILYNLYDEIFLDGNLKEADIFVAFSLSRRMTKSAGKTIIQKRLEGADTNFSKMYEIRMSVDFFFNFDLIEGKKQVCGIETDNNLDAMLLVFEHELCHIIESYYFGESNCSKQRFKALSSNLFGHKESHHQLPTHRQIAYETMGLKAGDNVVFIFEGKELKGVIHRINKRATVMVKNKNGDYKDTEGNRYKKFYVPLSLLQRS